MNDFRYKLDKGSKKDLCPECNKKRFVHYVDTETSEYLPNQYGRCDRESKCGYHLNPYKNGYSQIIKEQEQGTYNGNWKPEPILVQKKALINSEPVRTGYSTELSKLINFEGKQFTKVNPYKSDKDGILSYFTLDELEDQLNTFKKTDIKKDENPAILKGIYQNGTSGEYCETSTPYLFFDIDVNENENPGLLLVNKNKTVFNYLERLALIIWRSNSQKGMAGILYVPELVKIGHKEKEKHLQVAKTVYSYLEMLISTETGIRVSFDWQQGKFRQIRYLAQQSKNRKINLKPRLFYTKTERFACIPVEVLKQTLKSERYEQNVFIQNLFNNVPFPFEVKDVTKAVELYKIGTVLGQGRKGAVTFPFIDLKNNIRAVQVKQFNKSNHTTGTDFLHSIIKKHHGKRKKPLPGWLEAYKKNELKVSCLFGEHLLNKYPQNPVALVEAPKTAFYGTLYFGFPERPEDLIWLAVYNKSSFKYDKLKVLKGRTILTFPDLSKDGQTFKEWKQKATGIESRLPGTRFIFSDLLEQLAPEADKKEGNDIADYLIKQDWQNFRKKKPKQKPPEPETIKRYEEEKEYFDISETGKIEPKDWQTEIAELETFFEKMRLPPEPVKLNQCTTIINVPKFVYSHLQTVKKHNGNSRFLPYLNRLQELKTTLN